MLNSSMVAYENIKDFGFYLLPFFMFFFWLVKFLKKKSAKELSKENQLFN